MQTTSRGKPRRRVSLSSHATEIERWVGEGKTDEWIASALGTTRSSVQSFRSRSGIHRRGRPVSGDAEAGTESPQGGQNLYEGVLEHGEVEGYGLWLDPAVAEDPLFKKGFANISDVNVRLEPDRIVLEPASTAHSGSRDTAPTTSDLSSQLQLVIGSDAVGKTPGGIPESDEERGEVKFFDDRKGYGFIYRPDRREIFFHKSEIKGDDTLRPGSEVVYEVGSSQRGLLAQDVRRTG